MATATAPRQANVFAEKRPEEVPLLDQVLDQTAARLDSVASRYSEALNDPAMGRLKRAMLMATGIEALRKAITPDIMKGIMSLMNTPLGFKTDKNPNARKPSPPYDESVVRDCLVAALLHGVYPIGNEFNIISGQMYITKEGYERKLRETPGLTDLVLSPGVPTSHNGQTVVRFAASWNYNGIRGQLIGTDGKPGRVFPLISNEYTTPDALIGKATRKALKAIYVQIHGSEQTTCIDDEPDLPEDAVTTAAAASKPASKPTTNGHHQESDPFANPAPVQPSQAMPDVTTDVRDELNLIDFLERSMELIGAATTNTAINSVVADVMRTEPWAHLDAKAKKRFSEAVSSRREAVKAR